MGLEVLCHAEGLDLLLAEDGGHEFVGGEELLVSGILKVLSLEVSPKSTHLMDVFRGGVGVGLINLAPAIFSIKVTTSPLTPNSCTHP